MFAPDKVDTKILEKLTLGYSTIEDSVPKPLTSYQIRTGKGKISSGNWTDHRDKLLFFQLISKVYEQKPKPKKPRQKTREKIRNGQYFPHMKIRYDITPIGFCYLLNNLDLNKSEYIANQNFMKFIPLIAKHWKNIHENIGNTIFQILKDSIQQISLSPVFPVNVRKGNEYGDFFLKQVEEKTEIIFHGDQFRIIITRNYHTHSIIEKIILDEKHTHLYFPNYTELEIDFEKRLTFIFYFNLVMLNNNEIYAMEISAKRKSQNPSKNKMNPVMNDTENKQILGIIEDLANFSNTMQKKSAFIYDLIKNDDELKHVININLNEIQEKCSSFHIFDDLKQKIMI